MGGVRGCMPKIRLIARLDIKDSYVVKGIQLEGLRKIGDPNSLAQKYYDEGIDEIVYLDTVASLYNRNNLSNIVNKTTEKIFIPITVGGGIRSVDDVRSILKQGADKVAINTAALRKPQLLREIAEMFGSQCMVLSIQAKKSGNNKWEAFYDNGREPSGVDVGEWVQKANELGVGEIFLTSVDKDGLQRGMDQELIKEVCRISSMPVIASSGVGKVDDIIEAARNGASGVAIGSIIHYEKMDITTIKKQLFGAGIEVRKTW